MTILSAMIVQAEPGDPLCFTSEKDGSTLSLNVYSRNGIGFDSLEHLEFRLGDAGEWSTFRTDKNYVLDEGEKLYLRSSLAEEQAISLSENNYSYFYIPEGSRLAVSGDVTTLLQKSGTYRVGDYGLYRLFNHCYITTAPELPATELGDACYSRMFLYCGLLTVPPELPAKVLAPECYESMFYGAGLETAPVLPAVKLAEGCYMRMLEECRFTEAPELPLTDLADRCYQEMFRGCHNLVKAPELPATQLERSCYSSMFSDCTALTEAPVLPATVMVQACYNFMFWGCSSLRKAPALPAKTLADYCYDRMFMGCTSLTEAPELPGANIEAYCYAEMFAGCTGLRTAPALPVTKLAKSCYESMFQGCTGLAAAPELPATELAENCYKYMFHGCTALTTTPELPATELVNGCYECMFSDCASLGRATLRATTWLASAFTSWLVGVAPNGVVSCPAALALPVKSANGVPDGWTREDYGEGPVGPDPIDPRPDDPDPVRPDPGKPGDPLRFTPTTPVDTDDGYGFSILFVHVANNVEPKPVFEIREQKWVIDGYDDKGVGIRHAEWEDWKPYDGTYGIMIKYGLSAEIRAATDAVQQISGADNFSTIWDFATRFEMDGPMKVSGDVTTLLSRHGTDTVGNQGLHSLFDQCKANLKSAPLLPATKLGEGCYANMFAGTDIVYPPALPAVKLAFSSYGSMFLNCQKLIEAPELPATEIAKNCYSSMFSGCDSLRKAPALPALTAKEYCYENMFSGCTKLTAAPALPATKLAENCYAGMFYKCSSLRSGPDLPAPVLEFGCYREMYLGCEALTNASLQATSCAQNDTGWTVRHALENWLGGVYPYGTVTCPKALDIPVDSVDGVPAGWKCVRTGIDPVKPDPGDLPDVAKKPQTYNGYIANGNMIVGTIQVKAAKAKTDKKTKATVSALSISVQLASSTKKISLKGNYDLSVGGEQHFVSKDNTFSLMLGASIMAGEFNGMEIVGVVAGGDAARFADTYNLIADEGSFSVTVDKKGKVSVKGTSAVGKAVTVTTQLLVEADRACAPVIAAKAALSFVLWFESGKIAVDGLTDAEIGPAGTLVPNAAFHMESEWFAASLAKGLKGDIFVGDCNLSEFMPNGLKIDAKGTKWSVAPDGKGKAAKAGKVVLNKAKNGVDETKLGANPSGLKLTFAAKTGSFKGSFKAYTLVKGKLKSTTVNVSGVMINGRGYGTAIVKKSAISAPITIE